ncbi:MAG: phytoene/squalene synthase family protein [Microbacteriaceae bacterium]
MKPVDTTKIPTGLDLYLEAAQNASSAVIASYSTSFGLASKLLPKPIRRHVENIYALVRVADELVDGSAAEAKAQGGNLDPGTALNELEREVYRAISARFSSNLIVHSFAHTANQTGFGREIIEPFFTSMRMDLWKTRHSPDTFEKYVYGSAEVVGLMCLQAFIEGKDYAKKDKAKLISGARALGSAFQKVNFLRDLAADAHKLGRTYFPRISPETLTDSEKDRIVAEIRGELATASEALRMLPREVRPAVAAALMLFEELNEQIGHTPAAEVVTVRISVPNSRKLLIALKAWLGIHPK